MPAPSAKSPVASGTWAAARRKRAQVLVEAAVVFPLLLFVALGLVQFTLYVHAQNVVIAAAQDAARVAAAEGNHIDGAKLRGQQVVQAGLGTSVSATIDVSEVPQNNPDRVVVNVTAQQRLVVPWFKPNITLAAKTEMTKEHFRAQR